MAGDELGLLRLRFSGASLLSTSIFSLPFCCLTKPPSAAAAAAAAADTCAAAADGGESALLRSREEELETESPERRRGRACENGKNGYV